jgi:hypothetical protein
MTSHDAGYAASRPPAGHRIGRSGVRQLADVVQSGDEYTRAKTGLIQELTDAARAERGLLSVPVWED